jgi:molecular chaperone GrpE
MSRRHKDPENGHNRGENGLHEEAQATPELPDAGAGETSGDKSAGSAGGPESEGPAEAAPSASKAQHLNAALVQKDKEIAELKDKYLRALAESENARRRARQQSEENARRDRENILREFLPIVDNLERAVEAGRGGGNGKSIVEGVEMVLASMLDFLKRNGVTPQSAVGQPFDPARHEAVDQVASDAHPPNTVVKEAHRGYQIGERVLRPARVVVAKAADEPRGCDRDKNGEDDG